MAAGNRVESAVHEHPPPLLERVRNKIRVKHYSIRTEQSCCHFIKRCILFHDKRHPDELGADEVEAFLTHLAVEGRVTASTQNVAKSAVLFLYHEVLGRELPWLDRVERATGAATCGSRRGAWRRRSRRSAGRSWCRSRARCTRSLR